MASNSLPAVAPMTTVPAFDRRTVIHPPTVAEQIGANDTASTQVESGDNIPQTFLDLPQIQIRTKKGTKKFVRAELLNNQREKRSWIWEYGYNVIEVQTEATYWRCKICDDKHSTNGLYKANSTNGVEKHLINDHKIRPLKRQKTSTNAQDNDDEETLELDSNLQGVSTRLPTPHTSVYSMLVSAAASGI